MVDPSAGKGSVPSTFRTPCGLSISHINKAETEFVYREVFQDRVYLRHGIHLQEGDCVFDVGANIGLFTIFVQERFRGVKVLAFEPSPEIVPILRENTAKYGDAVTVYPCGISSETKQDVFTYYPAYSIMSGFQANEDWNMQTVRSGILNQWHGKYPGQDDPDEQRLELLVNDVLGRKKQYVCQMRSISEIIQESGVTAISLLKIDAEGSELDVLSGIANEDWPKIRQIALEIHDVAGDRVPQVRDKLEKQGFRCVFEQEDQFRHSGVVNGYALRDTAP